MSTAEENIIAPPAAAVPRTTGEPVLSRFVRFASSVRLGVILLCMLALACLIGMLIMQQNVDGFENYYAALTPAQRLLYTRLGFFDIYHVWYFNALLALLSLNIILASIERFPKTWKFVSKPQITVPLRWLSEQPAHAEVESALSPDDAEAVMRSFGWKRIRRIEKGNSTFVFAESGVWNRLGAYPVHVALLTIFFGGFLTAQLGTTGNLPLAPGESSDLIRENVVNLDRVTEMTKQLPFQVTFTDIEQKLIKNDGPLSAPNTLDWITRFTIDDGGEKTEAMVRMNRPYDYRGYRFFQASFVQIGRARNIVVDVTPTGAMESKRVKIDRGGAATLADGTVIRFAEFRGNFGIGPEDPNEDTSAYPNPAAVLSVVPAGGTLQTAYAFGTQMSNIPIASKPVAGYTYRLVDFEKVSDRHILSVQRDPGSNVVYIGFVLLFLTLVAVFFFSHQRVWVVFTENNDGSTSVVTAGNVNRNQNAFQDKFSRFVAALRDDKRATETL
jgi:cytochrome c biogenesis protein